MPRPARSSGDDRPTWADAAETARAVDQGRRLLDFKVPYVSFAQVELDSLLNCAHSSLREHRRRRVNPYYTPARCLSNRDRNAPVTNRKLDQ